MGVDIHGLNFLRYARKFGEFGPTVTLGRQGVHVNAERLSAVLGPDAATVTGGHAEPLLERWFGASSVESIDYSDYEGASILHDLNKPVEDALVGKYQTVVDYGTLEHVFNIGQALKNCSLLCREGGQILHVLPANNLCGHGLWQFSPELFFSLYSEANGYANTEIFLADLTDKRTWFALEKPSGGRRITFKSSNEIYVLVRTERARRFLAPRCAAKRLRRHLEGGSRSRVCVVALPGRTAGSSLKAAPRPESGGDHRKSQRQDHPGPLHRAGLRLRLHRRLNA